MSITATRSSPPSAPPSAVPSNPSTSQPKTDSPTTDATPVLAAGTDAEVQKPTNDSARTARQRQRFDVGAQVMRGQLDRDLETRRASPPTSGTSPSASTEGFARNADGSYTFNGSNGNDRYNVTQNRSGGLTVTNQDSSATYDLTAAQAANGVTINGGDGNDQITIDRSVNRNLTVNGGAGNDTLDASGVNARITMNGGADNDRITGGNQRDILRGGAGDDQIDGGAEHDYIEGGAGADTLNGGAGDDVMYGLDGADTMNGGAGRDYMDGGAGADIMNGGADGDRVLGGRGADTLNGGTGSDVLAGGDGADRYNGGLGRDTIYHQNNDTLQSAGRDQKVEVDMSGPAPGSSVRVAGGADYQARVQSDLDVLRSLPSGRGLLGSMDATGFNTTISETDGGNSAGYDNARGRMMTHGNTRNGPGTNTFVNYNPSRIDLGGPNAWARRPPIVGLYHEMVHAQNAGEGSMPTGHTDRARNRERIAVGLPIDADNNPSTPRTQPNRWTENGFRGELNLPRRDRY